MLLDKKVAIQNYNFSAYRKPFFERLSANLGHLSLVCGRSDQRLALEDVTSSEFDIHYVRNFSIAAGKIATFQVGAFSTIQRLRPDCIVTTLDPRTVSNLMLFVYSRLMRVPFVFWGHGVRPRGRFGLLYKILATNAEAVILYSDEGKRRLADLGVPADRMFVAYNSIDTSTIDTLRIPYTSTERYSVAVLGRLIPEKKTDLMLQAWAKLDPEVRSWLRLEIIGDGPEREYLEALANSLSLQNVVFHGKVYGENDLSKVFNRSLLLLSPGYVGLNAIHSMAYAVPLLYADDEPHSPEIEAVHEGRNGVSFRANDPSDLSIRLSELVRDPTRLMSLSAESLAEIQRSWTISAMVRGFTNALTVAMAHKRR